MPRGIATFLGIDSEQRPARQPDHRDGDEPEHGRHVAVLARRLEHATPARRDEHQRLGTGLAPAARSSPPTSTPNSSSSNPATSIPDQIVFEIPGPGPFLIRLVSPLPQITDQVDINGYSQYNFMAGTTPVPPRQTTPAPP